MLAGAPRVLVIYPGPIFSTKDVADNAVAGLEANGCAVLPFLYHEFLSLASMLEEHFPEEKRPDMLANLSLFAADRAVVQALLFRPDLVLVISGTVFPVATAGLISQYTQTAVWLTESPYQYAQEATIQEWYRTVFTNERRSVEAFQTYRRGIGHIDREYAERVYHLPHAYDPERHYPLDIVPDDYRSDVCFIGSPFPERKALLGGVNWDGIHFAAHAVFSNQDEHPFIEAPQGNVPNAEAQRWYAGAKININHHRTITFYGTDEHIDVDAGAADSLNPRVYELAAGRCFQICDDTRAELGEVFGDSIPTYRHDDPADLERVIRYYLARPDERERLAAEAYARVQAHTAQARMRVVLERTIGLPQSVAGTLETQEESDGCRSQAA